MEFSQECTYTLFTITSITFILQLLDIITQNSNPLYIYASHSEKTTVL